MENPRPTPLLMVKKNGTGSYTYDFAEPPKPVPDGRIVLRTTSGVEHTYEMKDSPRGWRAQDSYLQISTHTGWICWPWRSIFMWEVIHNSPRFRAEQKVWREWVNSVPAEDKCEGVGDAEAPA